MPKIEGNPRQTSIHAAGVVMSDDDLTNQIPLKYGKTCISPSTAHGVEWAAKMDFLGLRNLTFVQRMQKKEATLDEKYGVDIDVLVLTWKMRAYASLQ